MSKQKLELVHSFLLKLSVDDREKLNKLQESGINMSAEIRNHIRKKHSELNDK